MPEIAGSHRLSRVVTRHRDMPTFANEFPETQAAIVFAQRMHAGQHRADGTPFVLHPLEVASLLCHAGAPDHVVAAGMMHDLIEQTDVTAAELRERFGPRITDLVCAVSDDERIAGYASRKAALRQKVAGAGEEALTVFAADKLSKLRELGRETAAYARADTPRGRVREPRARRLKHYRRSLALLEERLPGSPLVRQLRDELAALVNRATIHAAAR
jgi:(p)ppGpp synthase/HD superfamily hydrolase